MNPIVKGWYADPEVKLYEGKYWVYLTQSDPDNIKPLTTFQLYLEKLKGAKIPDYKSQLNIDVFSSVDCVTWEKHENIIDMKGFPWVNRAVWAPTIIEKDSVYYLIFASNDIHFSKQKGGLEIAYSTSPKGPFKAFINRPLVNKFINKAQPIDAHLFKDDDNSIYLYYGGWKHCNLLKMNDAMDGFLPLSSGEQCKEITPPKYVEAPCMIKKDNTYYFMWSTGNWKKGTYKVLYSKSKNIDGPFTNPSCILKGDNHLGTGTGHHSVIKKHNSNEYLIFYHRRIIGDSVPGHRVLCVDNLIFDSKGNILPVKMT